MDQPAWLRAAWGELGVAERPGSQDNPRVVSYYREAGHGEIKNDEVAWCAAFAGAMLKRAGLDTTGSLLARSYLSWGAPLGEGRLGAVAVLERGSEPWAGHVGFLIGDNDKSVFLLGGNQSDAVTVAAFAKSRVLGYRWPSDESSAISAGDPPRSLPRGASDNANADVLFGEALAHVLDMEGGFSDDPYDPGGPTNRGITLDVFAQWKGVTVDAGSRGRLVDDLKRIPDALVRDIYWTRYWTPAHCEALGPALALFHFDTSVNHGVAGASRMLQKAAGVTADGEIGPDTLAAVARLDAHTLIGDYAEIRRARYRALPHFWRFGRGWLARVDKTEQRARTLITRTSETTQPAKGALAVEPVQYPETSPVEQGKWWLESRTIWGALITAAATVAPVLGTLIGIDLSGEMVRQAGEQTIAVFQALAGLFGTLLSIYGRLKASTPLMRKPVSLRF